MMWEVRFEGLPDNARAKPVLAWGILLACVPVRLIIAVVVRILVATVYRQISPFFNIRYIIGYTQVYL